jgi:acyl dehydratase
MEINKKRDCFEALEVGQVFKTEEKIFPERNLILGMLWEGDLQIHSDTQVMAAHPFGEKIVHGSSVTSMTLGLLFKMEPIARTKIELKELSCSYVKPVYVEDVIKACFKITSKQKVSDNKGHLAFNFEIFKKDRDVVCDGAIVIAINLKG